MWSLQLAARALSSHRPVDQTSSMKYKTKELCRVNIVVLLCVCRLEEKKKGGGGGGEMVGMLRDENRLFVIKLL